MAGARVVEAKVGVKLFAQEQVITNAWVVSFYGYDGHGSVRYMTDATYLITDTYAYDAYGILTGKTPVGGGATPNLYLYTGEQFDPDLGFYYLRARYNNPQIGRFWTMDDFEGSASEPPTLHKFVYCHANPVDGTDPSGHFVQLTFSISVGDQIEADTGIVLQIAAHHAREQLIFKLGAWSILGTVTGGNAALVVGALQGPDMQAIRARLKTNVEQKANSRSNGRRVLYYYRDFDIIRNAWQTKTVPASKGNGTAAFPPGGYASNIPPWDDRYTQQDLMYGFFGNRCKGRPKSAAGSRV